MCWEKNSLYFNNTLSSLTISIQCVVLLHALWNSDAKPKFTLSWPTSLHNDNTLQLAFLNHKNNCIWKLFACLNQFYIILMSQIAVLKFWTFFWLRFLKFDSLSAKIIIYKSFLINSRLLIHFANSICTFLNIFLFSECFMNYIKNIVTINYYKLYFFCVWRFPVMN